MSLMRIPNTCAYSIRDRMETRFNCNYTNKMASSFFFIQFKVQRIVDECNFFLLSISLPSVSAASFAFDRTWLRRPTSVSSAEFSLLRGFKRQRDAIFGVSIVTRTQVSWNSRLRPINFHSHEHSHSRWRARTIFAFNSITDWRRRRVICGFAILIFQYSMALTDDLFWCLRFIVGRRLNLATVAIDAIQMVQLLFLMF